ncbi:MAG: sigma-54 dependent transcriptional regulator [Desulfomonilaceae bacterium]|nr:sigma-54 dependent transcriptional regulator [Desulfomonilaceae bacterium]
MQYRLLIVEDEVNSAKYLARILETEGYKTEFTPSAEQALALIAREDYDVLLIDKVLPGMDGLEFLKRAKETSPDLLAVIITAYGSIKSAVEALKLGASDFLEKPVVPEKLLHVLHRILEQRRLTKEVIALKAGILERYQFRSLVGKDPKMRGVFAVIESLAGVDSPVLITGETGTGKDLVARAIHFESHRKNGPFVAINCAAVPETLLESELFGYERGAFTGAVRRKEGRFEQAHGGTLFLDEIGDISAPLQAKLLRTIQEKNIERLGGNRSISLDLRVIAATNKDLKDELASGRFRLDLYFRLNVVPIHLPPLRERLDDIPLLVDRILGKFAQSHDRPVPELSRDAIAKLMNHAWPGNVRELENVLERALIMTKDNVIDDVAFAHTPMESSISEPRFPLGFSTDLPLSVVRQRAIAEVEKAYLTTLLKNNKGAIGRTAADARIDARTVLRKMKQYGLKKSDFK